MCEFLLVVVFVFVFNLHRHVLKYMYTLCTESPEEATTPGMSVLLLQNIMWQLADLDT